MKRLLAVSFSLICFLGTTLPLPAQAAIISTQETLGAQGRESDLATVRAWLDRDQVRSELEAFGVAPELAAERVAALTDAELRQVAGQVGDQAAGGDLLGLIGVVFVVLLILELVGVTNLFTRI